MDTGVLLNEIRKKDVEIDKLAELLIENKEMRDEVLSYMIQDLDIMTYYHSYYVVKKACELNPRLFYQYWDALAPLLKNENSYKRDIGMTIIANLIKVDEERKFDKIFKEYMLHLNDIKFMTAQCCLKNLKLVIDHRQDLSHSILTKLLIVDEIVDYPVKQKELLKYGILDLIEVQYQKIKDTRRVDMFIIACLESRSPKTKKMARRMQKIYLNYLKI